MRRRIVAFAALLLLMICIFDNSHAVIRKTKVLNKKGYIVSVKSKKKHQLFIKWKKQDVSAYDISLCRKKDFSGKRYSYFYHNLKDSPDHKTIHDISSGVWYVRIRPVEKKTGNVYGKWSKIKKVKVK